MLSAADRQGTAYRPRTHRHREPWASLKLRTGKGRRGTSWPRSAAPTSNPLRRPPVTKNRERRLYASAEIPTSGTVVSRYTSLSTLYPSISAAILSVDFKALSPPAALRVRSTMSGYQPTKCEPENHHTVLKSTFCSLLPPHVEYLQLASAAPVRASVVVRTCSDASVIGGVQGRLPSRAHVITYNQIPCTWMAHSQSNECPAR
jgi:hypothetical protein